MLNQRMIKNTRQVVTQLGATENGRTPILRTYDELPLGKTRKGNRAETIWMDETKLTEVPKPPKKR